MGPQQDHQALGREPISKSDRFSRQQSRPIAPTSVSATAVTGADGAAAAPDDVAATIKSRKDTKNNVLGSARRHRVYDNIINQWKQAASSAVPKPRSSHPRVLGGEALTTRQVCVAGCNSVQNVTAVCMAFRVLYELHTFPSD